MRHAIVMVALVGCGRVESEVVPDDTTRDMRPDASGIEVPVMGAPIDPSALVVTCRPSDGRLATTTTRDGALIVGAADTLCENVDGRRGRPANSNCRLLGNSAGFTEYLCKPPLVCLSVNEPGCAKAYDCLGTEEETRPAVYVAGKSCEQTGTRLCCN